MLTDPHYLARDMVLRRQSSQGWDVPMTGIVPKFAAHAGRGAPRRADARRSTRRTSCATWPASSDDEIAELERPA